jgi:probable rRNA maturation factor
MKNLEIINKTKEKINSSLFRKIVKLVLKRARQKSVACLIFASDKEIKKLNQQYRKKNKAANVLSFPASFKSKEKFILPEDEKFYLGEIVISITQAKKQAKIFSCSLNKKLARLFVHGILHLLGYGHQNRKKRQKMERLEEKIMDKLKI